MILYLTTQNIARLKKYICDLGVIKTYKNEDGIYYFYYEITLAFLMFKILRFIIFKTVVILSHITFMVFLFSILFFIFVDKTYIQSIMSKATDLQIAILGLWIIISATFCLLSYIELFFRFCKKYLSDLTIKIYIKKE